MTRVSSHTNITQHTGVGSIRLERSHGSFHLSDLSFTYPLKLVAPRASKQCQVVYLLSYGGGLVGGDAIYLTVHLDPDTTIALLTQGTTKLFKLRPGLPHTAQSLDVDVAEGACCLLLPDPIQAFGGAGYRQNQTFVVSRGGSLVVLDWIVSGRPMNGEHWDFVDVTSINSIYAHSSTTLLEPTRTDDRDLREMKDRGALKNGEVDGGRIRLLARDCQIMNGERTKSQMSRFSCLATLLFTGPNTALTKASSHLLARFRNEERITGGPSSRNRVDSLMRTSTQRHVGAEEDRKDEGQRKMGDGTGQDLMWTVTENRGVTVLKVIGKTSESVKEFLDEMVREFKWRETFGRDSFRALE